MILVGQDSPGGWRQGLDVTTRPCCPLCFDRPLAFPCKAQSAKVSPGMDQRRKEVVHFLITCMRPAWGLGLGAVWI